MITPTPSVTAVVTRVTCLMSSSFALGIARTMATPTMGMNAARLSAQESNQSIGSFLLREENQRQAEQADSGEEHEGVLLDPARLHEPEDTARLRGGHADPVDDPVDALLVDDVVGEAPDELGADTDGVDDPVDDLLIGPVGGPGDGALDAADHAADEEVVEVVLLDQERVEGPEGRNPGPGPLGRGVLPVEDHGGDEQAGDGHGEGEDGQPGVEVVLLDHLGLHSGDLEADPVGELL